MSCKGRRIAAAMTSTMILLATGAAVPAWSKPKRTKGPIPPMPMEIHSAAFKAGETIPAQHTCKSKDVSPPLTWRSAPTGTKSLALICDDPDAPVGTWVHWVIYGIPPNLGELPQNVAKTEKPAIGKEPAIQGVNDFGKIGYGGPCPPPGPAHRYFFKLYALDQEIRLPAGATKEELLKALEGHILAQAELIGKFAR